ncbi:hypothetical protein ABIE10_000255 [Citrobacter sp. 506]
MPAKTLNYIKDNSPDYTSEVTMLHEINVHSVMTDKALSSYFHNAGELLADESVVLGQAVTNVILAGDNVNNKNIILSLISSLESTTDVVKADIIRKTLEIVLRYTADDV